MHKMYTEENKSKCLSCFLLIGISLGMLFSVMINDRASSLPENHNIKASTLPTFWNNQDLELELEGRNEEENVNFINEDMKQLLKNASYNVDMIKDKEEEEEEERDGIESSALEACGSRRGDRPGFPNGAFIQYIHIPKAGGTSIQIALRTWADRRGIKHTKYDKPFVDGKSEKCPEGTFQSKLLMGHRGFGYCDKIKRKEESDQPPFYFTCVREPLSRTISLFDYNRRMDLQKNDLERAFGDVPLNNLIKRFNKTTNIREYGERLLRFSGSQQTRYMCGYECLGPAAITPKYLAPDVMLAKAKVNLLRADAVGYLEEMNKLLYQLKVHMSWIPKDMYRWPQENGHSKKSVLDDEAAQILREWSAIDLEFYEMALRIAKKKNEEAEKCFKAFQKERELRKRIEKSKEG